ncbi:MAG: type I pantothenate kinase [Acidimicrobiaceae bacterium]|jgi:type I pantothenate kinase|nr:type I pantothenate kinase [Acidimicrobiaceae bacterium]|tara:strand:+ start:8035 stop:8922 length:888 start_codon:yes stop_codon:yes gene_type:complete
MSKETQFISRVEWLEIITDWNPPQDQQIEDPVFSDMEISNFYAPIVQRLIKDQASTRRTEHDKKKPLIIGVSGSVAVGKSTVSTILKKIMESSPTGLEAQVISTDNFLFSNSRLQKDQILHRKGFPESFDHGSIIKFLSAAREGKSDFKIPLYSHETYDIEEEALECRVTDVLILEGVNILQDSPLGKNQSGNTIRDYIDFSIFIEADEAQIIQWYEKRFLDYCANAETDNNSFFFQFKDLSLEDRRTLANQIWQSVNNQNLAMHINPSKRFADLIINKGHDHSISSMRIPSSWL